MRNLSLLLVLAALAVPARGWVRGEYLEARTGEVYTGSCASAEQGAGREAILAWRVAEGSWADVPLSGLSVVVVVRASSPLAAGKASAARSLILVDEAASPEQRDALAAFARASAGALLGEVVAVEPVAIEFSAEPARSLALLRVGQLAELRTRPFNRLDALCGDETVAARPLGVGVAATPAVALEHAFHGDALGAPWEAANSRGAFVGTFAH